MKYFCKHFLHIVLATDSFEENGSILAAAGHVPTRSSAVADRPRDDAHTPVR